MSHLYSYQACIRAIASCALSLASSLVPIPHAAMSPLVVPRTILVREAAFDFIIMVYTFCLNLICAFLAPVHRTANRLIEGPAPDRVRLHGVEGRAELDGFHATKCTGTFTTAEGGWVAVQLPHELIFVHEETETTPVAPGVPSQAIYSSGSIAVLESPGRGYGMVASQRIARGDLIFAEAPLAVILLDESDDDPALLAINNDARTVVALAQMRLGAPPPPEDWASLPGMKSIAERITMLQSERGFGSLPHATQVRWMRLCDSSCDSLGDVDGSKLPNTAIQASTTAAGILHSNGFGGTANGRRTCVLFETLSRCNHSCTPNIDVQTSIDGMHAGSADGARTSERVATSSGLATDATGSTDDVPSGYTVRVFALRDIEAGEELCLSYLGSAGSARMERSKEARREELRRKYRFHCECGRCGAVSAAARRRYERLEALAQAEDEHVSAQVAAFNAGTL